jgi:MinD-like ATPase involved in chromosome partitioning or flagellar assembly
MRPQQPDSFIVQFIAPRPGAGTSVVAEGYAKVAAEGCGRPVLLVDCGRQPGTISRGRPGLVENFVDEHTLSDALVEATGTPNLLLARFSGGNHPLLEIDRGRIGPLLKALRREAAVVVLDCPPVTDPGAAALAGHADGTVLVMAAGKTRITDLADARDVLQRRGGTVMGTVFNRERHLLPRWLDRVL